VSDDECDDLRARRELGIELRALEGCGRDGERLVARLADVLLEAVWVRSARSQTVLLTHELTKTRIRRHRPTALRTTMASFASTSRS